MCACVCLFVVEGETEREIDTWEGERRDITLSNSSLVTRLSSEAVHCHMTSGGEQTGSDTQLISGSSQR